MLPSGLRCAGHPACCARAYARQPRRLPPSGRHPKAWIVQDHPRGPVVRRKLSPRESIVVRRLLVTPGIPDPSRNSIHHAIGMPPKPAALKSAGRCKRTKDLACHPMAPPTAHLFGRPRTRRQSPLQSHRKDALSARHRPLRSPHHTVGTPTPNAQSARHPSKETVTEVFSTLGTQRLADRWPSRRGQALPPRWRTLQAACVFQSA